MPCNTLGVNAAYICFVVWHKRCCRFSSNCRPARTLVIILRNWHRDRLQQVLHRRPHRPRLRPPGPGEHVRVHRGPRQEEEEQGQVPSEAVPGMKPFRQAGNSAISSFWLHWLQCCLEPEHAKSINQGRINKTSTNKLVCTQLKPAWHRWRDSTNCIRVHVDFLSIPPSLDDFAVH